MKTPINKVSHIYLLKDPRDGRIRYVGQSVNPKKRFYAHLYGALWCTWSSKRIWINELKSFGLKPELDVIYTCPLAEANYWEFFWAFIFQDENLLNELPFHQNRLEFMYQVK